MKRLALALSAVTIGAVVALTGPATPPPAPGPAAAPSHDTDRNQGSAPHQAPDPARHEPAPRTVHITVSGPHDTLMRVSRAGAATDVELRGEPFDFEFTEEHVEVGQLGISVFANSATPQEQPLRCAIRVDGVVVANDTAETVGGDGTAEVACTVPFSV
ncbi:hypothetical protein SAMN05421810_101644 [Amycolatopsis arida]|uniref:Uncharacterized protein n=1 Tax=Amycolatopsis arida TaxID=587909 RepID=A0A1I5LSD6_9PSEU|nr:hypothetical protein [Amycolatopsis arida]TDX93821.1 hypothetical protein CLV69_104277 [Amycolatopsis arida]SFP00067.1 hypothetical protein SAMN05421810_101644 [Amycolatopsis arida]